MAGTANPGATTATNAADGGVKEQTQDVKQQAGEQMRKASGQASDRVRQEVDQRSTQAGEQVNRHASDLRQVAEQLRGHGKEGPARIAEQVAERAERAGSWMKESDTDRILGDVEDFARSRPWAVAAGGVAVGFVASRLLKASSSRRYEQRLREDRGLPPTGDTTAVRTTPPTVDEPLAWPAPGGPNVAGDRPRTPSPGGGL
jgi:hypothetical protein